MNCRPIFSCLVVLVLLGGAAHEGLCRAASSSSPSPDSTALGVVWTPPDAPGPALQALNRIHALGATAIRLTTLPRADTIFARADTLGLSLFVDLPVSYVGGGALSDSLNRAAPVLDRLRALAQQHRSVQYVGLAHAADTTVPPACSVLATWTDRLHAASAPLRTYYVTPFPATTDRCAQAVDLPLLDTRALPAPAQRWRAWTTDSTRAGIGALGTWTHRSAQSGLRVPHSPERQARYLERRLSRLLDSLRTSPPALFVYRWHDDAHSPLSGRRYGLHDATDARRPVADVTNGFFRGTQRVFAFPAGPSPASAPHGLLLFGWGLLAALAGLYASSPFVQQTALRYFTAHGFYRDAVGTEREVSMGLNTAVLVVVVAALGLTATALFRLAAAPPVTEHLLAALPPAPRSLLADAITHPSLAGSVVGGVAFLLLGGWALALTLAAQSEGAFSPGQGLMLVVWPCWPALAAMLVALVGLTAPPASSSVLGAVLVGGGGLSIVAVTIRVLWDFWAVRPLPLAFFVPAALASPLSVSLIAVGVGAFRYEVPLLLLWHLLTRT